MDYQLIEGGKFDLVMKFYEPGALGFDRFANRCAGEADDSRTVFFREAGVYNGLPNHFRQIIRCALEQLQRKLCPVELGEQVVSLGS